MSDEIDPSVLLRERYVLDDQAPNNATYGPLRRWGVFDRTRGKHALLPNAVLCWGLTRDEAVAALVELRTDGKHPADNLREPA